MAFTWDKKMNDKVEFGFVLRGCPKDTVIVF